MKKFVLTLSATFLFLLTSMAQTKVTGRVTGDNGQPVHRASILVKGTELGTATQADGTFEINVPKGATTLVVTAVDMLRQEVKITGSALNISLISAPKTLEDVVVTVPYGTIKKSAFTGAENTVTAATIQKQQVTSVTNTLEGLIPGISTTNGGGAPGSNAAAVRIRGVGSVSATSNPLYVLNGIPYDGSIVSLSTDDIESVTVLKDAAASALYGSRAANGVIMITTKSGRKGKPSVSINFRNGFMTRGIPEYDRVNEKEYYELFWEAYRNNYVFNGMNATAAGIAASNMLTGPNGLVYNAYNVPGNQLVDPLTGKLNPNAQLLWHESWEDALYNVAPRTNLNVSVSGASENSDYFLSAGYLHETGIMRKTNYDRFTARLNVNTKATSWLKAGINLDGTIDKDNFIEDGGTATNNPFYFTRAIGPIYPVYQHDLTTGAIIYDLYGNPTLDWGRVDQMGSRPYGGNFNPVGILDLDQKYGNYFQGNLNTYADVKLHKNLSFKTTFGINYSNAASTTYRNNQFGDAAGTKGRSSKGFGMSYSITANEVFTYSKEFGDHNFKLLGGHENYAVRSEGLSAEKTGFLYSGMTELSNGGVVSDPPSSYVNNLRIESYFSNLNYDYKGRYLFSASYRRDGSSRFAPEVRWGGFYSVGAGWRISQEQFMNNVTWLNDLKLRASYGEQGNDNIGMLYQYGSYYVADGFGGYAAPEQAPNRNLKWEKNAIANIGLDFAVFKNRLTGSIDWFNRISDNLLFEVPVQVSQTHGSSKWDNLGTMKNYGFELQLGYNAIMKKDFNWRIDLNLTHYKNKITKLPPKSRKAGILSGTKKLLEGGGIYDFWIYEYAGVDASNGDALYWTDILDAQGESTGERRLTNVLDARTTRYKMGSAIPDFSGGLTNAFSYKGFDLSILTTFAYGGKFYDGNYANLMHRGSAGSAWSSDILNRWQNPGDVTNVPRVQSPTPPNQDGVSSRWLFDGSYLNIKNITLSYTLPKNMLKNMFIGGVQVFVNVDNVYLFTAKKGMDPQRSFAGTSDFTYPPFRTITFGFNLNLQ